jgi:hypothetical protein
MSYANYPVLASVNKVSLHAMLPEVEVVLVKAVTLFTKADTKLGCT